MRLTDFHAKYFAHELTKRCSSNSVEKLASVLADAQVDLNPHQVEAELFAFRSPFSRGAILADEVGLGKTIEAGLLLSQRWAERKRRFLVQETLFVLIMNHETHETHETETCSGFALRVFRGQQGNEVIDIEQALHKAARTYCPLCFFRVFRVFRG